MNTGNPSAMFFAFRGVPARLGERIVAIKDGFEVWDLHQFSIPSQFVSELQQRIPPVNENTRQCYVVDASTTPGIPGLTVEQLREASWGLFLPRTLDGIGYSETLFLLNLYSRNFLYPVFFANNCGITYQRHKKDPMVYQMQQDYRIFFNGGFVDFFLALLPQSQCGNWYADRVKSWDKEDWRLFVAALLYRGLTDFENEKDIFAWQRESAEMITILESLLTAEDKIRSADKYRLCKRIAVLLSWRFPGVEQEIVDLYGDRNSFVHGGFFSRIAKDSSKSPDGLAMPDFDTLYKCKEYVRFTLAAYLHLAKVIRGNPGNWRNGSSVMDMLEASIIDTGLRGQVIEETRQLFGWMPYPDHLLPKST